MVTVKEWLRKPKEWLDKPAVGRAIAPVSLGLVGVGVIVLVLSLFASSGTKPSPSPTPPEAQAHLRAGLADAKTYFAKQKPKSFEGFTPAEASKVDSAFVWNKGPDVIAGEVTIEHAGKSGVLLLSKDSSSDTVYCIALTPDGEAMGSKFVAKPGDCSGGW